MDNISQSIAEKFEQTYSIDGRGDNFVGANTSLTLGVVVNTDDPLQSGRLGIFCPTLNDDPKKIEGIPWSVYCSPFGGIINNSEYYRGTDEEKATTSGGVHYGFWGIPELGAHVLVGCIDGDPRRRFWVGCVPEHQQTNTIHTGRWKFNEGTIEGPLSSDGTPIEPFYTNSMEAFDSQNDRPEYATRVAEYQTSAVSAAEGQTPNSTHTELDQDNEEIIENTPDEWVHDAMGSHGNDWSGFKKLGEFMSSRVYGISTPGMHSITMDDRPFNQRVRIKTTAGHQVILDDTNERIYINTFKGKNYFEMDVNGDVNVYSATNINLNAEDNINLNADKIRMTARRGIHGFAGSQYVLQDSFEDIATPDGIKKQDPLEIEPQDGEIRFHASADLHIKSEMNIRQLSNKDTYMESNGSYYGKVDESYYLQVDKEINIITNKGDYNLEVAGDLGEVIAGNSKRFTFGKSAVSSNGSAELMSFEGTMDMGALNNVNVKSSSKDVSLEAQGNGSGSGNIQFRSPKSQIELGDDGISSMSDGDVKTKMAGDAEISVMQKSPGLSSPVSIAGLPKINRGAAGELPPKTPVPWDGSKSKIDIDQAVQVAYNAGWRDEDLNIAVAVMMGESSLRTSVTNKAAPTSEKWGEVVGLFQIRTLKNPDAYAGVDRLRDNAGGKLEDPNVNAKVAYEIWEKSAPPGKWTVGKWESFGGKHQGALVTNNLPAATEAVNRFYGNKSGSETTVTPQTGGRSMKMFYRVDDALIPADEVVGLSSFAPAPRLGVGPLGSSPALGTALKLGKSLAVLQGMSDIEFKTKSLLNNNNSYNKIVDTLNETIALADQTSMFMATMIPELIKGLATTSAFTLSLPFNIPIGCLMDKLYNAMMPQALIQAAATLEDLNNQLQGIVDTAIDMYNIGEQLVGNVAALTKLGLPLDFSIDFDAGIGMCVDRLQQLSSVLKTLDIPRLKIPSFDGITAQMFSNNSINIRKRIGF